MTVIEFPVGAAAPPRLAQTIGRFRFDPLGFVMFAFPWDTMRRRGLASPDDGDALALTFAYPVYKTDWAEEHRTQEKIDRLKRYVL